MASSNKATSDNSETVKSQSATLEVDGSNQDASTNQNRQTQYSKEYQDWLNRKAAWEADQKRKLEQQKTNRAQAEAQYQAELKEWERQEALKKKAEEERLRREEYQRAQAEQARQAELDKKARQQAQQTQSRQQTQQTQSRQQTQQAQQTQSRQQTQQSQATQLPSGNIRYQDIELLDYPVNTTRETKSHTRPYTNDRPLTLDFIVAPSLGLAKNEADRARNAKEIARRLGSGSDKYRPSDMEILKLAYVLSKERSSGADLGYGPMTPVNVQRERAAILYAIINSLEGFKTHYGSGRNIPKTIEEALGYGREYIYYPESDQFQNIGVMEQAVSTSNRNLAPAGINLKSFVKAFFDGYFNNEIDKNTHWSHMRKNKWSFFHIPPDAKWPDGSLVRDDCTKSYGCTSSTPVYLFQPNGFFSRAFKL
jgi:hypothetical protein